MSWYVKLKNRAFPYFTCENDAGTFTSERKHAYEFRSKEEAQDVMKSLFVPREGIVPDYVLYVQVKKKPKKEFTQQDIDNTWNEAVKQTIERLDSMGVLTTSDSMVRTASKQELRDRLTRFPHVKKDEET